MRGRISWAINLGLTATSALTGRLPDWLAAALPYRALQGLTLAAGDVAIPVASSAVGIAVADGATIPI